jgi:hypothetical protein
MINSYMVGAARRAGVRGRDDRVPAAGRPSLLRAHASCRGGGGGGLMCWLASGDLRGNLRWPQGAFQPQPTLNRPSFLPSKWPKHLGCGLVLVGARQHRLFSFVWGALVTPLPAVRARGVVHGRPRKHTHSTCSGCSKMPSPSLRPAARPLPRRHCPPPRLCDRTYSPRHQGRHRRCQRMQRRGWWAAQPPRRRLRPHRAGPTCSPRAPGFCGRASRGRVCHYVPISTERAQRYIQS